jgi:hypothetical protein
MTHKSMYVRVKEYQNNNHIKKIIFSVNEGQHRDVFRFEENCDKARFNDFFVFQKSS